jgi:hypothetical protein
MLRSTGIKKRAPEHREPVTRKLVLTKDRKRELLRGIAENHNLPATIRIRAIEIDSMLAGHFMPERTIIEIGPNTLAVIEELMNNLVSTPDQSIAEQISRQSTTRSDPLLPS